MRSSAMRNPLPRFLLPSFEMQKAIEMNAREDKILSTALEQLDKEKKVALSQLCWKEHNFIKKTVKRNINFTLTRKVSAGNQEPIQGKNSFTIGGKIGLGFSLLNSSAVTPDNSCSYKQSETSSRKVKTNERYSTPGIIRKRKNIWWSIAQKGGRNYSPETKSCGIGDRLPILNGNNDLDVPQKIPVSSMTERRISMPTISSPRGTKEKWRRATVPHL